MTRAASDCTSEHGKNYFDSRLMSDMGIYRQPTWIVWARVSQSYLWPITKGSYNSLKSRS